MARIEIIIEGELLHKLNETLGGRFFSDEYYIPRDDGPSSPALGPMYDTVARVNGLSIRIFADEHPPPHFHVSYQGQEASFSILDCSRLRGAKGLERYEGRIRDWWRENQSALVEKWNALRPTDCPVGVVRLSSCAANSNPHTHG
jgi:hypothetical protein